MPLVPPHTKNIDIDRSSKANRPKSYINSIKVSTRPLKTPKTFKFKTGGSKKEIRYKICDQIRVVDNAKKVTIVSRL